MANRAELAFWLSIGAVIVSSVVVCLRLFTRLRIVRSPGLEDILIVSALFSSIATTILTCQQVHYGMGRHLATLTNSDKQSVLKAFWGTMITYNATLSLTKISIILQYLRLFYVSRLRPVCLALLVLLSCHAVAILLASIFGCTPVTYAWNRAIPGGHCSRHTIWYANSGVNILSDLVLIGLPMPAVWRMNLPARQKHALVAIFALGAVVCVASVVRLHYLHLLVRSSDRTFANPPCAAISSIEINVGIICASAPALRPLFSRFLPGILSSGSGSRFSRAGGPEGVATFGGGGGGAAEAGKMEDARRKALMEDTELGLTAVGTNESESVGGRAAAGGGGGGGGSNFHGQRVGTEKEADAAVAVSEAERLSSSSSSLPPPPPSPHPARPPGPVKNPSQAGSEYVPLVGGR